MNIRNCLLAAGFAAVLGGSVSAATMSAIDAEALLVRRGYTDISTMRYEGGLWLGTAVDASGMLVDVRVDPVAERITTARTTITTTTTVPATPVVIETRVIEQPIVRIPIIVQERVLVPAGGKIGKDTVQAVLSASGYHSIHDIDWLETRGVWKAEARDAAGDDREIHVDPYDARITHVEDD